MKNLFLLFVLALAFSACGNGKTNSADEMPYDTRINSGYDVNGNYRTIEYRHYEGIACVTAPSAFERACYDAGYSVSGDCGVESLCSDRI